MMQSIIRILLLFLSFAFGAASGALGIYSLVESNRSKAFVKSHVPAGVSVSINTQDIFSSGVVLTVASGLLALTSFLTIACPTLYESKPAMTMDGRKRFFLIASLGQLFFTLWIFAALIPVDIFSVNRSAQVSASIGGRPLPASVIQAQQLALGVSPVYWSQVYVRALAIVPWFAFLFGLLSGIELFSAYSREATSNATSKVEEKA